MEWLIIIDDEERLRRFSEGELDLVTAQSKVSMPEYQLIVERAFMTGYVALGYAPPLDDVRVRRALVRALGKNTLNSWLDAIPADGGIIPPGMPGHSPGINLPYDLSLARRLLAEAGYPDGNGFPIFSAFIDRPPREEIVRQWREGLGIDVRLESGEDHEEIDINASSWHPDYPDPDNFLRQAKFLTFLRIKGWNDPEYEALVERAVRTSHRAERMALYREADRRLIDQVLVIPILYNRNHPFFGQAWVGGLKDQFGFWDYSKVHIKTNKKPEG